MNEFARYSVSSGSATFSYVLKWQLLSQDRINNYSTIRLQASIIVLNNYYIAFSRGSATIHNQSFNLATRYNQGETVVYTMDIPVYHDSNGKASITIGGFISTTYLMNGNCQGIIHLPDIDRSTPSVILKKISITENSATFSLTANSAIDKLQAMLNGNSWFDISGTTFTINNLNEETNYTLQVRVRKTSNQIYGNSNLISFTTLAGTFAEISLNGSSFKKAEVYLVTTAGTQKVSKDYYKSIGG